MTRRYYGDRALRDVATVDVDGRPFVTAELRPRRPARATWLDRGRPIAELRRRRRATVEPRMRRPHRPTTVVVDLYLSWPTRPGPRTTMAATLARDRSTAPPLAAAVRRASPCAVCGRRSTGAVMHLHVPARTAAGWREDRLIRGAAPADRPPAGACGGCANFNLTRLPSADGRLPVPLRRAGTTRPTSGWSRWPQVRDLTALRDADGRVVALPAGRARPRRLPRRDPPGPGRRGRAERRASTRTGSRSTSGRRSTLPLERADGAAADGSRPPTVGRRAGGGALPRRPARRRRPASRSSRGPRSRYQPGAGVARDVERAADRAARSRSTTTRRRCCARGGAARSTPTS